MYTACLASKLGNSRRVMSSYTSAIFESCCLAQIKMSSKSKEDKAADRDRSNLLAMLNATYD